MSDVWQKLRGYTSARIGLTRAGVALSTPHLLEFQRAHAEARQAVWQTWNCAELQRQLQARGEKSILVETALHDRAQYLKRPDLGRRLRDPAGLAPAGAELAIVVSDGLSPKAIEAHFLPLWQELAPRLRAASLTHAPLVLAPFSRVAVADEVGERLGARVALIFIGERPGLSASDSLGIYLTFAPRVGNTDADRNCLSNVREPGGLGYKLAADKLMYLLTESLRLQLSGVALKEDAPVTSIKKVY